MVKKLILTASGCICLGLGAVGVVLPVMPTTPFVLLAALCFSAGNNKIAKWLQQSRVFGPYIENYHTKQGVSRTRKAVSIIFVWTGLIISMVMVQSLWICVMLVMVGVGVTIHLLLIKTKK